MDGLEPQGGPQGQAGAKPDNEASLDDAISAAMAEWPQDGGADDDPGQAYEAQEAPEDDPIDQQPGTQAQEPAQAPEALHHWPADKKDAFSKLPPKARNFVLEAYKDFDRNYTRKFEELASDRKIAEAIRGQFSDAERYELQQRGMTEAQVIQGYRQLDALYRQNPLQYVQLVMQQAGIKPEQLQSQPGKPNGQATAQPNGEADGEDDWEDPDIKALKSQLQHLEQQLGTTRQEWNSWTTQQRQAHSANAIQYFASSKDEGGNPKYPHFSEAQEKMAWVMQNHNDIAQMPPSVEKLEAAYERVIQLDPHYRQLQEQRMREEMEKKFSADRTRSASTPRPKPGASAQVAPTSDNLDDIISQAMRTASR